MLSYENMTPRAALRRQTGNALFLILIAVALFAALSYAVTQSGRGGGSVDKEQAAIAAAQLVQGAAAIQQTVQRMIVTGTPITSLSFANDPTVAVVGSGVGTFGAVGNDPQNEVFHAQGGGLVYVGPPTSALDSPLVPPEYNFWQFTGGNRVQNVGRNSGTTAADFKELILMVIGVKRDVCLEINKQLKVNNPGGNPPVDADGINSQWWGPQHGQTYITGGSAISSADLDGKPMACFESAPWAGTYIFYLALVEK